MSHAQYHIEYTKDTADEKVGDPKSPDPESILEDYVIVDEDGEDPEPPNPELILKEDVVDMVVEVLWLASMSHAEFHV
jgi:hypothetical protein